MARAFDIPIYVQYGAVDLGVTGHDVVVERSSDIYEIQNLGFGECELVVAIDRSSEAESVGALPDGAKIATQYPNISSSYFRRIGKEVDILVLTGAIELAPRLGLADAIVDVSTTGETLRRNNLRKVATILQSTSRLIANKLSYKMNGELFSKLGNMMVARKT